jgi:hypothetical protein
MDLPLARRIPAEVARPLRCSGDTDAAPEMPRRRARQFKRGEAVKTRPRKPKGVSMSTVREVERILRGGKKSKRRHAVGARSE